MSIRHEKSRRKYKKQWTELHRMHMNSGRLCHLAACPFCAGMLYFNDKAGAHRPRRTKEEKE